MAEIYGSDFLRPIHWLIDDPNIPEIFRSVGHRPIIQIFRLHIHACTFNSLPNDKLLDWTKLKAFADDKISVTEN